MEDKARGKHGILSARVFPQITHASVTSRLPRTAGNGSRGHSCAVERQWVLPQQGGEVA
jgi:hypothetical protein